MEHNRIQKLLLSEYCDFSDKVLIESPFAETTRDGRGLRQVALGLTATKLIIAADVLKKHSEFTCPSKLDPSIESFELVSIYPIEFVALSIFSRRKRTTLKARLVDGRAKYYELGGMERRSVYRALWMEHVRQLNAKKQDGSSLSETTAASSSSASTLYLLSSGIEEKGGSKYRVWAHYGAAGDGHRPSVARSSWRRKDIYLGPSYEKLSHQGYYAPVPVRFAGASLEQVNRELLEDVGRRTPMRMKSLVCRKTRSSSRTIGKSVEFTNRAAGAQQLCDVLFTRETRERNKLRRSSSTSSSCSNGKKRRFRTGCTIPEAKSSSTKRSTALAPKLSRFGFGIGENCASGLYLEAWQGDKAAYRIFKSRMDPAAGLIDSGVHVWEHPGDGKFRRKSRSRHPRRYALATAAHFFHALGPWSVQPGERESVQRPRACSAVSIRRQPLEPELRLAVSKRQLAASVSMTSLDPAKTGGTSAQSSWSTTRGARRVLLFWTPEYWYRPRAATAAYQELRRHLSLIRDFRASKERAKKPFFSKFAKSSNDNCRGDCGESKMNLVSAQVRSSCILGRIFSSKEAATGGATATGVKKKKRGEGEQQGEGVSSRLRRLLKMDLRITAWDLDSWTIARQLTLIDRELFLRIPWAEIEILLNQKSSRNAPNLGAWIAFSHRISCLTASEILATKKLDMRTRLLSRLINAADKCYALGNFHSCRSILAGLESPPIYRLKATWSRLRTRHSTRYDTMERLCRIYRNTRSRLYGEAWKKCERKAPCLPYVGHLVDKIIYRQDDEQAAGGFVQNDSCRSMIARVCSTTIESACRKIVETEEKTKELVARPVASRKSLSKRIVSAAMSKIGCSKSTTPGWKSNAEIAWTVRQDKLAKKYYARWRLSILTKKILADKEAKLAAMDPKKLAVMRIGSWLYECQKNCQQYHFSRHSFAWEFLLKARYREERDNFFTSLKLEPPLG